MEVNERKKHRKSLLASLRLSLFSDEVSEATTEDKLNETSKSTVTTLETKKSSLSEALRSLERKLSFENKQSGTADDGRKSTFDDRRKSTIDARRKSTVDDRRKSTIDDRRKSTVDDSRKSTVDDRRKSNVDGSAKASRKSSMRKSLKSDGSSTYTEVESVVEEGKVNVDDVKRILGIYKEAEQELEIPKYVKIIFMQVSSSLLYSYERDIIWNITV